MDHQDHHQQRRVVHFRQPSIDQQQSNAPQIVSLGDFLADSSRPDISSTGSNNSNKLFFLVSLLNLIPSLANLSTTPSPDDPGSNSNKKRPFLPAWISNRLTFYRLHWTYFITIASIATICLWLFPKPHGSSSSNSQIQSKRLSFIDCMYTAVSSVCTTGLISVRMQDFSTPDTILLMFLMVLGSPIFTSVIPLYIRQYQFKKNIRELEFHISCASSDVESVVELDVSSCCGLHRRSAASIFAMNQDEPAESYTEKLKSALEATHLEYEAIVRLNWLVSAYFSASLVVGLLVLGVFFQTSSKARQVLRDNQVNQLFFLIFQTISAFTNSGLLLLNDNMVPLRQFNGILLWSSVLILIGNTMFAPCLRALIWIMYKCARTSRRRAIYDYLLKNPRRCFTHLFPRNQTIWLVVTVMSFNAFESVFFYILSWKSDGLKGLNVVQKIVNGIFQSITTRSAGENVVAIGGLSPSMLVLYIAMMYIAVYPVYLSRQNSQAQEQPIEEVSRKKPGKLNKKKRGDFTIATQSKRLIARDSAFLFISVFVLCIIENRRIDDDPLNFSIFNIIFEVISAYGNVGLSVGYSCALMKKITSNSQAADSCVDVPYSFSGKWSLWGKLLMIVIMFLGRHRGLPDNMDSALQLPKSFFDSQQEEQRREQQNHQQQQTDLDLDHQFIVEMPAATLDHLDLVVPVSVDEVITTPGDDDLQRQEQDEDEMLSYALRQTHTI